MTTQNPNSGQTLRDLYQQLQAINHEAFASGEYDVAYHALMAALHCVQTLKDVQGLDEVERAAQEQLTWIDRHAPHYEHSTLSAQKRGHFSIYHTLARQAGTRIRIIQAEEKWHGVSSGEPDPEQ